MAEYQPLPELFPYDQHSPRRPAPAWATTLSTFCYDALAHPTRTSAPARRPRGRRPGGKQRRR